MAIPGMSLADTIMLALRLFNNRDAILKLLNDTQELLGLLMPAQGTGARITSEVTVPDGSKHRFDVPWLQQSLNMLMPGQSLKVDGNMGPRTIDAIKRFQQSRQLKPDGWAGLLTLDTIDGEMRNEKWKQR